VRSARDFGVRAEADLIEAGLNEAAAGEAVSDWKQDRNQTEREQLLGEWWRNCCATGKVISGL
jgi:hypothetical protein